MPAAHPLANPFAKLQWPNRRWPTADSAPHWLSLIHRLCTTPHHEATPAWAREDLLAALRAVDVQHQKALRWGVRPQARSPVAQDEPPLEPDEDVYLTARPSELLHRALAALVVHHACQAQGGQELPQPLAGSLDSAADALALKLLCEASSGQGAQSSSPRTRPWQLQPRQRDDRLTMTVMVVEGTGQGAALPLELTLVRQSGAHLALVAAPEQLLTPTTEVWARGLVHAQALWRQVFQQARGRQLEWSVAWNLLPSDRPYDLLKGDSASAAIALGGLWLLAHRADLLKTLTLQDPWLTALQALRADDLQRIFLTAAVASPQDDCHAQGRLKPVGGLQAKDEVLALARQLVADHRHLTLHTAEVKTRDARPPSAQEHASLLQLARRLARLDEPCLPEQTLLAACLRTALAELTPPVAEPSCPHPQHALPALEITPEVQALLRTLSRTDESLPRPEVRTPLHYALHRWALHGQSQHQQQRFGSGGQMHRRFVNLELNLATGGTRSFNDLSQLLASPEVQGQMDLLVLEGEPGSGKTWLLQRHEQALCEQFVAADLQAWPAAGAAQPVLPLYLTLRDLPADADPVAHFQAKLAQRFPEQRLNLHEALAPSARRPYHLQVLLDGLNEVPVPHGPDPETARVNRVKQVVHALWRAFAVGPGMTLVLGSRPHRPWQFGDARQPLRWGKAQLLRWSRGHIERYLEQRWPGQPQEAQAFMAQLPAGSALERLLGLPLFLNLQCDLWDAGARHLTQRRSQLLASMLWLRLAQAHEQDDADDARHHLATPGMLCAQTELPIAQGFREQLSNRQAVAWTPEFARRGLLLKGLFALAKRQWRWQAGATTSARGNVGVSLALVDEVLHPLIREEGLQAGLSRAEARARCPARTRQWLAAVAALGLGQVKELEHSFHFSHQVFSEWLASQDLLYDGASAKRAPQQAPLPTQWSPRALARLRAELSPPALARDASAELAHQQAEARQAWELLPDSLVARWLHQGIGVPLTNAQEWLNKAAGIPFSGAAHLREGYEDLGFLSYGEMDGQAACFWGLRAFGDYFDEHGLLPRSEAATPWAADRGALALLVTHANVWPLFQAQARADAVQALGGSEEAALLVAQLWAQKGQLQLPPPGPLDDILPLALDGLSDGARWWEWLAQAATPCPGTGGVGQPAPWHLLSQCLRQQAAPAPQPMSRGAAARLDDGPPPAVWASSARHLLQVVLDARGHDPRQRIQAGLALGLQGPLGSPQGDHLRYERVPAGVRLRRHDHRGQPQWVACGGPGQVYRLSADAQGSGPLGPAQSFERFEVAAYPVTVGEFEAFLAYPGALDPEAAWWRAAGPQAQAWVAGVGLNWRPSTWHNNDFNNPLQPVTGVTAWAADAYVHWAQAVLYAGAEGFEDGLRLALPTEWQLEAALRGPWAPTGQEPRPYWPGHVGEGEPDAMLFNHVETGWGKPSPVGCFGGSTTAQGLADGAGNTWAWCANTVESGGQSLRALRGGGYHSPARHCAAGVRNDFTPGDVSVDDGFRLGRVVVA